MKVTYDKENRVLILRINSEVDHFIADRIKQRADFEIETYMPKSVLLDFENVDFMDSAGIGLIVGRYKTAKLVGSTFKIINVKPSIKKILEMSGILKIIPIDDDDNNNNE